MWMPGGGVGRPAASADDVPAKSLDDQPCTTAKSPRQRSNRPKPLNSTTADVG